MSSVAVISAVASVGGAYLSSKAGAAKAPGVTPDINLNSQAANAISGNTANESSIEALLARANAFNQSQANSITEQAMPGFGKLKGQLTTTAGDLLKDPYALPSDVKDKLSQIASERGISAGTRGQFNDFSLLKDFGINSLDYGNKNIAQAGAITQLLASITPKVNPLSPMSMYVTPQQSADVAAGNRSVQQAGLNANAAVDNYNNANMWSNLTQAVGGIDFSGATAKLGGTGSNRVLTTAPAGAGGS